MRCSTARWAWSTSFEEELEGHQGQMTGEEQDIVIELSAPVRAATVEAVGLVRSVLDDLLSQDRDESRS